MKALLTIAVIAFFAVFSAPSFANLGKEDQALIAQAESYLQNLKSGQARFVQTTHDGTQLVGTFYIHRPGRLKFEYDAPIEDFVVADGVFIYFYDAELQQQTNAPIGQTLADFFLQKKITLSGELSVTEVKRGGGLLQITLVQEDDPAAGSLVLGFAENKGSEGLTLQKWRVVDGQGLINEVELFYLKTDIKHPSGLFVYVDPKPDTPQYND